MPTNTLRGDGEVLYEPSDLLRKESNIRRYLEWLEERNLKFRDYWELWDCSVAEPGEFWKSLWQFFEIAASAPYLGVLSGKMPGAKWFEGAKLNYADHVFRNSSDASPALIFQSELQALQEISWKELYLKVSAVATALRKMGLKKGDRAVALMPNIPEATIAFLACASLGVIWSSCSPDFGGPSIIDRFRQIEPKILFTVDGYRYNGKDFDLSGVVAELREALTTIEQVVLINYLQGAEHRVAGMWSWDDLLSDEAELSCEQVEFDHPLWILYSSGTTGPPKPIVQGHGGILLEHLKCLSFHLDLKESDRLFWFTTTGWMMWNLTIGGLLLGSTVVLYDGSPWWPDANALWKLAENSSTTLFGTSAAYISSCMKNGTVPKDNDLSKIKAVGVTGSPLPPEGFKWIYEFVKPDLWLVCMSGGTDLCTAFVGGCPLLPVRCGEMQCRSLGAKVEAFDEQGNTLIDQLGELVITEPMPSMPLFFWNDEEHKLYKKSYFEMYPGVWRHGDWVKIDSSGSVQIYGRSDSTINRHGVRMGTSEMYRVVEELPEILDSLVVDLEGLNGVSYMPLFVVLQQDLELTDELKHKICARIRSAISPRHVPDEIFAIPEVPRTLNGKKMEVPIKKILAGIPVEKVVNADAMSNPESIAYFVSVASKLRLPQKD